MDIAERLGDRRPHALALSRRAKAQLRLGHHAEATVSAHTALGILDSTGHYRGTLEAWLVLAEACSAEQDYGLAVKHATRAVELADDVGATGRPRPGPPATGRTTRYADGRRHRR